MKTPAIIVDFDGTLYDCSGRRKQFLDRSKKDFEGFNANAQFDPPHFWCAQLVKSMANAGFHTVFVSGREEKWRTAADWWLWFHLRYVQSQYTLLMRPNEDYRTDVEVKKELWAPVADKFEVLFAVDDRQCVVDMWRSMGITCLQCDKGDF